MDWSGTPDDPHGYFKSRQFTADAADRVGYLGQPEISERLRVAGNWIGTPGEWMGECGLALRDALTAEGLPNEFRADLEDALAAIRTGFRRGRAEHKLLRRGLITPVAESRATSGALVITKCADVRGGNSGKHQRHTYSRRRPCG